MSKKKSTVSTVSTSSKDFEAFQQWLANGGDIKKLPSIKAKSDLAINVTVSDFKGQPTISMVRGEVSFINKPFTFGKAKAQMIVEQFEAIKKFAESK